MFAPNVWRGILLWKFRKLSVAYCPQKFRKPYPRPIHLNSMHTHTRQDSHIVNNKFKTLKLHIITWRSEAQPYYYRVCITGVSSRVWIIWICGKYTSQTAKYYISCIYMPAWQFNKACRKLPMRNHVKFLFFYLHVHFLFHGYQLGIFLFL